MVTLQKEKLRGDQHKSHQVKQDDGGIAHGVGKGRLERPWVIGLRMFGYPSKNDKNGLTGAL